MKTPTSPVCYRYGRVEDGEAISRLGAHVFALSFASLMQETDLTLYLSESYSVSKITTDLQNPLMTFIVATRDDAIVGFMQLTRGVSEPCIDHIEKKIWLQRLYISEEYQGQGIGKYMLARAESEAKETGLDHLWLAAWELNPKAESVYKKAGYLRVGEMRFNLGNSILRDWVMIKPIQ